MKLKKLLSMGLALTMALSLAACGNDPTAGGGAGAQQEAGSGGEGQSASTSSGGQKIGIAMPTKSLERWNRDGTYLKEQFENAGYSVELTYSDNVVTQQVNDIENLISGGVNILIVAAIDGESLSTVLNSADEAGIPVVSYDRLIRNTKAVDYYVSFDNYKVGVLQGQYVIDTLGLKPDDTSKSYNIEFTAGDPADNNATFFFNGAFDTLKPFIDSGVLKVVSGQTSFEQVATPQWDSAQAMDRMQNILASNYSSGTLLDVALCSNDSTALGVTQAIESDYAGSNIPIITGQDGDEANLKNIVDGKQSMTVYKAVANEAVVTLELVQEILKGGTPDESLTSNVDCECIYDTTSYDNGTGIVPSYLLTPSVVTKDTIQTELVDTGYYTMEGGYPKAVS